MESATGEDSESIRQRVEQARKLQLARQGKANYLLGSKEIDEFCQADEAGLALLKQAINKLNLSARAYHRILKVARTIADLADSSQIKPSHIAEAVQYRTLDRMT